LQRLHKYIIGIDIYNKKNGKKNPMPQIPASHIPFSAPPAWPSAYRMPGLVAYGANELSRMVHAREISCSEVMQTYLGHISALNPIVNAIVSLREHETLMSEAVNCDQELAKGKSRGWLHGIPQAIKDLSAVSGIETTMGSPLFKDQIPENDSFMVKRIRQAGAIFIGKTNTPEFGLGSQTFNTLFGATRNAFAPDLTAGGSSGGAAAALALHMLPVADGSDMMGSLRNPAAYHNIYGLRPTFGRIPAGPNQELYGHQLGTEGPMARNIIDLQRLLATQAGHEPRAPLSLTDDPASLLGSLDSDPHGTRIAWLRDWDGSLPIEEGVIDLCEKALINFENLGCIVEKPKAPMSLDAIWSSWITLRQWAILGNLSEYYLDSDSRQKLKPEAQWEIREGFSLSALDVHQANVIRSQWFTTLADLFYQYDFLVLPSAQCFPFSITTPWPQQIAGRTMDTYHRWMQIVVPGSLSGCPILNLPAGFNRQGLPMGIQVIAPHRRELSLMRLGKAYESTLPAWKNQRPAVLSNR
jgi:amidase